MVVVMLFRGFLNGGSGTFEADELLMLKLTRKELPEIKTDELMEARDTSDTLARLATLPYIPYLEYFTLFYLTLP